jgi:hypothetical protein
VVLLNSGMGSESLAGPARYDFFASSQQTPKLDSFMSNVTRIETSNVTRVEGVAGPQMTCIETQGVGPCSNPAFRELPARLTQEYQIVHAFQAAGAEADLYLVDSLHDQQRSVLKLYRRGLQPKTEVLSGLKRCSTEHVVRIDRFGESDGTWFEILEYSERGNATQFFRARSRIPR